MIPGLPSKSNNTQKADRLTEMFTDQLGHFKH